MTTPSKTALKTAMTTSISEVLETMFFMSLEISEEKSFMQFLSDSRENGIASRINFKGPISGCLLFFAPKNVLADMASNFMGLEEDELLPEHYHGTIKEVSNMLAGNTFSHYNDQAVFNLEIPEIIEYEEVKTFAETPGENDQFIFINTLDGELAVNAVVTQTA